MKRLALSTLIILFLLTACSINSIPVNSLLGVANIETQTYTIDITIDNTIVGKKGSIITIPANAILSDEKKIELNIVEAFSIEDMISAGLTTTSNGIPLSSGGMIYINPVQQATIAKSINVALPTDYYRKGMELFKGAVDNSGNINWQSPVPLNDTPLTRLDSGRMIFERNCTSCHHPLKDATGPALAEVALERERGWFEMFTLNSARMIAEEDPLAVTSYCAYNGVAMTAFDFTHEEVYMMYDYLVNVAKENDLANRQRDCYDSCMDYAIKKALLIEREALVADNGHVTPPRYMSPLVVDSIRRAQVATAAGTVFPDNLVEIDNGDVGYYRFSIDAFGWYNVDIFTKDIPGFEDSELFVRLIGTYDMQLHMYLVIPHDKVFVSGGLIKGSKDTYGFFTDDGKLPLPQNQEAYILGMGELDGSIVYGKTTFVTTVSQNLEITLDEVTKEEFDNAIAAIDMEGVDIEVGKSKNADKLAEVDKQLKELDVYNPAGCDCSCSKLLFSDTGSLEREWR